MRIPISKFCIIILLLSLLLAACAGAEPEAEVAVEGDDVSATGSESTGGALPPPPETGAKVEVTRAVAAAVIVEEESREVAMVETDSVAAAPAAGGISSSVSEEGERAEMEPASELTLDQDNRLTAGEVDDNLDWDDYLLFLRNYQGARVIRIDVSERHQIWVKDTQDNPILGARIGVEVNGQEVAILRTHSDGRAFFFPRAIDAEADEYTVNVSVNDGMESFTIPAGGSQREWFVTLPNDAQATSDVQLDILFLIDATGSMSDEINQLKSNIQAIADQIDALPSRPDIRFGMVHYRDREDEYVTRISDFTPDLEQFASVLAEVSADGGGDYPEDLNEALSRAVHEPEWRVGNTVSLIFLVADAPPHLDYSQQNHYGVEVIEAAERGIKIYPIASSGLDSQGEYIFRQLAQLTGGRFIFLTYGSEGPGTTGTETDFQVSDYTVSSLDTLVVKIVEEELSFLQR